MTSTTTEPLHSPPSHHDGSPPKRPKGILKNRSTSNANADHIATVATSPEAPAARPDAQRGMSERDIVLANTIRNAGGRRSSSRGDGSVLGPGSRRQSSSGGDDHAEDGSPRLKWDEANLYLAEQEREAAGARMKIDEPKTPFAKQYDPEADDVADAEALDPNALVVDEIDAKQLANGSGSGSGKRTKDFDIPGLELGDPEMDVDTPETPDGEKRVVVEEGMNDVPSDGEEHNVRHGEESGSVSQQEKEKHRKFEEARRRHYEMGSVKGLLGHPEELEEDDDDDDSRVPSIPRTNGQ